MRALVDIPENVTDGIRLIVGLIMKLAMGTGLMMTFGASCTAAHATETVAAKAEVTGTQTILAQREHPSPRTENDRGAQD